MNEHMEFQDNPPGRGQVPPIPYTAQETDLDRVRAGLTPALVLPPLIVVLGPTASGKSALSIELARHFHGEIVSADSRQVYRGLDIGTAKVTHQEQALVRHHLLDINWPREVLYARIDARVDERIQQGMIQETRDLLAQGVSYERLDSLGLEYRYTSRLLRGDFASEAEMAQRLKYAIHDFTRRQLSWFRKDTRIVWLDGMDVEGAEKHINDFLNEIPAKR